MNEKKQATQLGGSQHQKRQQSLGVAVTQSLNPQFQNAKNIIQFAEQRTFMRNSYMNVRKD